MGEEWEWLETGPVFSDRDRRGGRVVRVPHGVSLAPVGGAWMLTIAMFAVSGGILFAAVGFLIGSVFREGQPEGWWWLALVITAGALMLFFFSGTFATSTERAMQPRSVGLISATGAAVGVAIGLGILAVDAEGGLPWSEPRGHAGPLALLATGVALVALILAVLSIVAVRDARREVRRILELRASGSAVAGMVMALPDPKTWSGGGEVPIRYDDGTGERVVPVRLTAYAHEIPVRGTRVIVRSGAAGGILVEFDPEHPPAYTPHRSRYEQDSSGGGS